jgi:hypothetical protein
MPLFHSGHLKRLFFSFRPFRFLDATVFLTLLFILCCFPRVTFTLWALLIPVAVDSLSDPQFSWVQFFRTSFFFRYATVAWQDTFFLQAAAKFLRDPQFPRVSSFGSLRHPSAHFRPLRRFFRPSTDFTTAFSLATS